MTSAVVLLVATGLLTADPPTYVVEELDFTCPLVVGIDDAGVIYGSEGQGRIWARHPDGEVTYLEVTDPKFETYYGSNAVAVSAAGRVTGSAEVRVDGHNKELVVVWDGAGAPTVLDVLYPDGDTPDFPAKERAIALNAAGDLLVDVHLGPWLRVVGGTPEALPATPWPEGWSLTPRAIGPNGVVVGGGLKPGPLLGADRGFYLGAGDPVEIPPLGDPAATKSSAWGIDAEGRVFATSTPYNGSGSTPYRWSPSAGVIDQGDGTRSFYFRAVNGPGVVVGATQPVEAVNGGKGLLYLDGEIYALTDLVTSSTEIGAPHGINDRGVILAPTSLARCAVLTPARADLEVTLATLEACGEGEVCVQATVTNHGPAPAEGVTLTVYPPGTTTWVPLVEAPGDCVAAGDAYRADCPIGRMSVGESVGRTFRFQVAQSGLHAFSAEVTGSLEDPDATNDTASASTTADAKPGGTTAPPPGSEADLRIEVRPSILGDIRGEYSDKNPRFLVVVTNDGPGDAVDVVVRVTAVLEGDWAGNVQVVVWDEGGLDECSGTDPIQCTLSALPAGESAQLVLVPDVLGAELVPTVDLRLEASVLAQVDDPNPANDSAAYTETLLDIRRVRPTEPGKCSGGDASQGFLWLLALLVGPVSLGRRRARRTPR
ncbi:MAG: hypothetical protein EP329_01760 [Deltaproteobacteria bacterium]|nr:MAG: hypothetical protein EP329_01760 [Deltaproteobacteria bacterium]